MLDALFINPDSSTLAYQALAQTYAAIEPPTWALLLAQACRAKGYGVGILDCAAERLTLDAAAQRVSASKPRLIVMVVYGQNPNAGTTNMSGALRLAQHLKQWHPDIPICFVGSHTSALPLEVLGHRSVDLVLLNEGVYALHDLLASDLRTSPEHIRGIGYKRRGPNGLLVPTLNPPQRVVPQDRMDIDLPGYAWDLLPYRVRPLDLYRAHFWHAGFDPARRTPFAAIYTSLGCPFGCDFCMINIVNRSDNAAEVSAADSRGMRFWSPAFVVEQLVVLARMGVETVRISDEMFFLNRRYYEPILRGVVERGLRLNIWTYSRVDTIRRESLELFRRAGVTWLALGVEAGNQFVRQEVAKGSFKEVNIREICRSVRDEGLSIISNYIFGLPDDTLETMTQTLDLALELNTEMANMYPCQALPGSPLHQRARRNNWKLPDSFEGYGFLSYAAQPLATKYVSAQEVLRFRDAAWQTYFTSPSYLDLVERRFGLDQRRNVVEMSKIRLRRKLLGD